MILSKVIRILSCVCVLCFWGCGGGSDSSDTSTDSSTAETASTPASPPGNDGASGGDATSGSPSREMAMGGEGMMDPGAGGGAGGDPSGGMSEEMMQMDLAGGFGPDGAEGGYPGGTGAPRKPPRPEKISDWTPEQVAEAISESDEKAITAIQAFANKNRGKVAAVEQLSTWITALTTESTGNSGGEGGYAGGADAEMMQEFAGGVDGGGFDMQGGGQRGGAKPKIAQALLAALATNGTPNAYAVIRNVLKGELDLGVDKEKATALAMTTLIKSISDPNSPGRGLLWAAFTSNPPTGSAAEKGDSVVSLHQRAKELHLGFAIAAMNGLIGASGPPPKANGNQFGGVEGMEGRMMEGGDLGGAGMDPSFGGGGFGQTGGQQQQAQPSAPPVKITPVFLNKEEAEASLTYIWSKEMTQFVAAQLKHNMNSAEYLVFAGAFPTVETRNAVQAALNLHKNQPPSSWVHESVFSKQLTDPAVHVYVKSLPREQRAEAANKGGTQGGAGAYPGGEGGDLGGGSARPQNRSRSRSKKKEKEPDPQAEARKEARYGWMKASEGTLISLMERMYQGTMQPDAAPYQTADLPFQLHRGAEVTASLRFALPGEANASNELRSAQQTLVSYVRIESKQMSQKTVQHYRSVLRDEEVVTILGGNGMWLDGGVKPNKKDGMLRSVDILLSRSNSRPSLKRNSGQRQAQSDGFSAEAGFGGDGYPGGGQGGGEGKSFVVELLVVEVPDTATKAEGAEVSSTAK